MRLAATTAVLAVATVATLGAVASASGPTSPAVPPSGVRTVVLTVRHSGFTPNRVSVAVGTTVRFVVRNLDPIDHELIVGDAATHRRHERGREAHHGDVAGEVSVPAGTSATTTYVVAAPGPILFACHLPGHFAYGMRGVLVAR